jgi:predicted outer membrane repeat protein
MLRTTIISFCITSSSLATTWTVDDDGKAEFNNIQAAIQASSDGDEIVVMPGIYIGTGGHVINTLSKAIWIHSSDGPEVTVIDGEATRRGINCTALETSNTIIEGFTVTGCIANDTKGNGSGLYCSNSSPTLINCTFTDNFSVNWGGGAYLFNSDSILVNCQFTNNYAERWGGGMFCDQSMLTLTNCTFRDNTADVSAGGLILMYSDATVTNCMFEINYASANGGGIFCFSSSPTISSCNFDSNTAGGDGGGIRCFSDSSPTIVNCTFRNNTAYDLGGAIANVPNGLPSVEGSFFCESYPTHMNGIWSDDGDNFMFDVCQSECPDITSDGQINVDDLLSVFDQWGANKSTADVNTDGVVDFADLLTVIGNWGSCN